ncbi:hypothetical protein [Microbulbifer thermotolerans]|uniref:hypothetical protein n=1 Tax=Microbulbifer thermotolerans TaxID=252514 RepID=UPI00224A6316|nr:hypothetical protein [Microbulbifer thermotolerans]MCX2833824.1 hypothetical protein [Microbulbifer thermotolerans]
MSSIHVRKAISSKHDFAGRAWFYEFRELSNVFEEKSCQKMIGNLSQRFSLLTRSWSEERNSEWLCRTYLSSKMILTATLNLNALEYSNDKNLRVVTPYLAYYSILSLLRAVVYMLPEVDWQNGKLVSISHSRAMNLAFDYISSFDKDYALKLKEFSKKVKAYREFLSYRSPSSGDLNTSDIDEIEEVATLLAEVAQFTSEIMESSIIKNADESKFVFLSEYMDELISLEIEGVHFFDNEDYYRLGYLARKYPVSPNIQHIMTEGHVEDFFGAWLSKSETECEDEFNPDEDWQKIFDVP